MAEISFVGTYPVLYEGGVRTVPLTHGLLTQPKLVRPIVGLSDRNDDLMVGIQILDDGQQVQGSWMASFTTANIVAAYQILHLLTKETELSHERVIEDGHAVLRHCQPDDPNVLAARQRLGSHYDQALRLGPDRLLDALGFLQLYEVDIDTEALVQAVRDGVVEYQAVLQEFGVKHPKQIDARQRRRQEVTAPYLASVRKYLDRTGHQPNCACLPYIERKVVEAICKGLDDPTLIVGYALGSLIYHPVETIARLLQNKSTTTAMMELCQFLVGEFEQGQMKPRTAEQLYHELHILNVRWEEMPMVKDL